METYQRIRGHENVIQIFRRWPTFHDAEIISMRFNRNGRGSSSGPTLHVDLHTFLVRRISPDASHFTFLNHSIVTFRFDDVSELELKYFNNQNAIQAMEVETGTSSDPPHVAGFRVTFDAAYGADCSFWCAGIEVESITPGIPPGSVYARTSRESGK